MSLERYLRPAPSAPHVSSRRDETANGLGPIDFDNYSIILGQNSAKELSLLLVLLY